MPDREIDPEPTDSESIDATQVPTRTADPSVSSASSVATSRRDVLGTTATALAGGTLLAGVAGRGRAASQSGNDRPLDVRTTDVEVLDEDGVETTGTVEGMERVDAEKCRVGAQISRADHDEWYGGVHDAVTVRASARLAVTLAGLHPGKYDCRLVACPVTHDHVCFGNSMRIVADKGKTAHEKEHRSEKEEKEDEKKEENDEKEEKEDEKKEHHGESDDCPCELHHPGKHHLTFHADDWRVVRRYAFAVSARVERSSRSCVPDLDEYFAASSDVSARSNVVTGALAGGADSFLFPGQVTQVQCDDGVDVFLDGESV